jgi:hypothetical protein
VQHRRGGSASKLAHHVKPGNRPLLDRATHIPLSALGYPDLSDHAY